MESPPTVFMMFVVKVRRISRRSLPAAWEAFSEPFLDSGQAWSALVAAVIAFIAASQASFWELLAMADQWAKFAQAVGYAVILWGVVSLLRTPWIVIAKDRRNGAWHHFRFVYHQPLLVTTIHCTQTYAEHRYHFRVPDAEPDSMVYCTVEFDRPVGAIVAQLGGDIFTQNPPPAGSYTTFRLRAGNMATMILHNMPPYHSGFTARIYCQQFEVMNDRKT